MGQFQITIKNTGGKPHDFCLYAKRPDIQNGGPEIFQAAMANLTATPGGKVVFEFTHDLYAICGNHVLQSGVEVEESVVATTPIALGQAGDPPTLGSTYQVFVKNSAAAFSKPQPSSTAGPGTFRIKTGKDFNDDSNIYAGIASKDTTGDGYTTNAVFSLDPNATFSIKPHFVYYIATGSFKAGKLIDVGELGDPVAINFVDGANAARTDYVGNGTYTAPKYTNV